jgi:multiple sugar transport system permease protein
MTGYKVLSQTKKPLNVGKIVGKTLFYAFAILLALALIFPYIFMINRGLMSNAYITKLETRFWTDGLHFVNYLNAFRDGNYGGPLLWSLVVCTISGLSAPLTAYIAGYAFAKLEWIGKKFLFSLMMLTALVPSIVTQVPLFVLYTNLGLLDTLWPLFLPGLFFGGAPGVFLMRQFLLSVPKELEESAVIDGANVFRRAFQICAPMCMPVLIYMGVGAFMGAWGDFLTPSIYNTGENKFWTFAYALYYNQGSEVNSLHPEWIFAAATVLSIVPLVLFAAFQKHLIGGIATVGLKG